MKKWAFGLISCVLALTGLEISPAFVNAQTISEGEEIVVDVSQDGFEGVVDRTFKKDSYKLIEDIDGSLISSDIFNGYGADGKYFTGVFDGNGYTIKNLTLNSDSGFYGLFPYAKNATIKNLKIEAVSFNFDAEYNGGIYAGLLVGYGENVVFENCEIVLKNEKEIQTITLAVDGEDAELKTLNNDITFGFLGGRIVGNAGNPSNEANIKNCLIRGNVALTQTEDCSVDMGLMIGTLENGFISHSICEGQVSYSGGDDTSGKNIGGIVGRAVGTNARVNNVCLDGDIICDDAISKGYIIGGIDSSNSPSEDNFDYCYWTELKYTGIGNRNTYSKETFINIKTISHDFLAKDGKFNDKLASWDFDKTWLVKSGEIYLQRFLTFSLYYNGNSASVFNVTISATDKKGESEKSVEVRYGQEVVFELEIKGNNQNWCQLSIIKLNDSTLAPNLYTLQENKTGTTISGYTISVNANAMTAGDYFFQEKDLSYSASVEASCDEEGVTGFGGVKVNDASSTGLFVPLEFSYNLKSVNIEAVSKGKYIFQKWKLFYRSSDGNAWVEQTGRGYDNLGNGNKISITYTPNGSGIYNQEFKLVALFTKDTKIITLGGFDKSHIKYISINNEEYIDGGIEVAKSSDNILLKIVTNSSTITNLDKFVQNFNSAYANSGQTVIEKVGEQKNEEFGEVDYTFKINLKNVDFSKLTDENVLSITFSTQKVRMGVGQSLLWLYILLSVVFVGIVATIIIIVIRKKSGKGKGKQKNVKKVKESKKSSYKDYYV